MAKSVSIDETAQMSGVELGVSDWLTIDQDRVTAFADATLDHQWIHLDAVRAEAQFGGTIAHGFLSLSLLVHLMGQVVEWSDATTVINYGCNKVRFTGMVPTGSAVRGKFSVDSAEPKAGGMQVGLNCVLEVQGQERPALVANWLLLLLR
ncbi:MAG: MaoC family dehydratase [Pseudomonadota bacterium]